MRNNEVMTKIICFAFAIFLAITGCSRSEDENLKSEAIDNTEEVDNYYLERPEFFSFKTLEDLPADLKWTSGDDLSEIGSEKQKKGGTEYRRLQDFPVL